MVDLDRLEAFGEAAVVACPGIKSHCQVSSEAEFKDVKQQINEWPVLVSILPFSQGDDVSLDNYAESNQSLFYILKPTDNTISFDERKAVWKETQQAMKEFKAYLKAQIDGGDFMDLFHDLDFAGRDQKAEYNFIGTNGWSLAIDYSTDGL